MSGKAKMKTGTGHGDSLCLECGIDAGAMRALLEVLEPPMGVTIVERLRIGGYPNAALRLEAAIKKAKR